MKGERKIEIVGRKASFAEAEEDDIFYWADKTWQERIVETERLRRMIWIHRLGAFPQEFEITGRKISKNQLEEDDF
jgi:hypothetical protein